MDGNARSMTRLSASACGPSSCDWRCGFPRSVKLAGQPPWRRFAAGSNASRPLFPARRRERGRPRSTAAGSMRFASRLARHAAIAAFSISTAAPTWSVQPGCCEISPGASALPRLSLKSNAAADPWLNVTMLPALAKGYLGDADPRNHYASPLYGDASGLPPTLIHVGSDEILRDDAVRMAEKLRAAGCEVEIEVWLRMPHAWHLYARILPEGRHAIARIGSFLQQRL